MLDDRRGATAVEVGLIAPAFMLLIAIWVELGSAMFVQAVLDNATRDAARLIRTGAIQTSGSEATFKSQVCAELGNLIPCTDIVYRVQSGSSFSALSTSVTTDSTGGMSVTGFSPGASGDRVVVQVGYVRTFILPVIASFFTNGKLLILSTVAFQNEPY